MLDKLSREERLQLMRFICSFAWADLEVRDQERALINKLVSKLHLDADEAKRVRGWLEVPPDAEAIDPQKIPRAHRQLFLDAAREVIASDGEINAEENESFRLLEQLTR
jgi:uncharacterized tellurite resistance protein B-like protein